MLELVGGLFIWGLLRLGMLLLLLSLLSSTQPEWRSNRLALMIDITIRFLPLGYDPIAISTYLLLLLLCSLDIFLLNIIKLSLLGGGSISSSGIIWLLVLWSWWGIVMNAINLWILLCLIGLMMNIKNIIVIFMLLMLLL